MAPEPCLSAAGPDRPMFQAALARLRERIAPRIRLDPEPGPYVGSRPCVTCHSDESRELRGTRHARTFHRGSDFSDSAAPRPAAARPRRSQGHAHLRAGRQDQIKVRSEIDDRVYRIVVEYAFGTPRTVPDDDRPRRGQRTTGPCGSRTSMSRRSRAGDDRGRRRPDSRLVENRPRPARSTCVTVSSAACTATSRTLAISATRRQAGRARKRPTRHRLRACHGPGGNHISGDQGSNCRRSRDRQRRPARRRRRASPVSPSAISSVQPTEIKSRRRTRAMSARPA